jgi:hypothetical protein
MKLDRVIIRQNRTKSKRCVLTEEKLDEFNANTKDYLVFGLCPLSGILNTKESTCITSMDLVYTLPFGN